MRILLARAFAATALLIGLSNVRADIVVPNSAALTEGNGTQDFPFSQATRYQQVFSAAEFASLGGPVLITGMTLRPDAAGSAFSKTIADLQINLSTTSQSPDGLSTTFASNVGADDTIVFDGSLTLATAFTGPVGGPKNFDIGIGFTPFLYDPSAGNLLLDVRNASPTSITQQLDAVNVSGDGVSRTYTQGIAITSPTANFADSSGLVVRFTTATVPEASSMLFLGLASTVAYFCCRRRRTAATGNAKF
jgi:hypothetical protein